MNNSPENDWVWAFNVASWNELSANKMAFIFKKPSYLFFKINIYLIYNYNTIIVL
jgi:hypothetical protein